MIEKLYAVLVIRPDGKETIFAMAGDPLHGIEEPMQLQCAGSEKEKMEKVFEFARTEFPDMKFRLTEFVRAN